MATLVRRGASHSPAHVAGRGDRLAARCSFLEVAVASRWGRSLGRPAGFDSALAWRRARELTIARPGFNALQFPFARWESRRPGVASFAVESVSHECRQRALTAIGGSLQKRPRRNPLRAETADSGQRSWLAADIGGRRRGVAEPLVRRPAAQGPAAGSIESGQITGCCDSPEAMALLSAAATGGAPVG